MRANFFHLINHSLLLSNLLFDIQHPASLFNSKLCLLLISLNLQIYIGNQAWDYKADTGHMVHQVSGQCMTLSEQLTLVLEECQMPEILWNQSWTLNSSQNIS